MSRQVLTNTCCYHCGAETTSPVYVEAEKNGGPEYVFCCIGCLSVYKILSSNNLCSYYVYNDTPGITLAAASQRYDYLDEPDIVSKLIDYTGDKVTVVTFYIPSIHCSSCIWLLENLYKLDPAIIYSRIDFLKKQVRVTFNNQDTSLRKVVELMFSIGYEPLISLQDVVKENKKNTNRELVKKIAVAGFCMGNVMLLSFPEYFGLSSLENNYRILFRYLNMAFAVPVVFYSGRDFFTSAWAGLKHKMINLDAPLALIITVLFCRSVFDIINGGGPGFIDTLTGLIFLLLIGRWVRQRTYSHLSFERDYRSYFPVAVMVVSDGDEKAVPVEKLEIGDRIFIRNGELIPADSILIKGSADIDFSFVTGESATVSKTPGEMVYAGGRQTGSAILLEVVKPVSQSYLTGLWNNGNFSPEHNELQNFNDTVAKYFSLVTFIIAFTSAFYWMHSSDSTRAWNAFTSVLIVACPCVLALSTPFTLSSVLALFDKHKFYLKNTDTVEKLSKADSIVFDKTGTITSSEHVRLSFSAQLTENDRLLVASITRHSNHPLSREIVKWLKRGEFSEVSNFIEIPGKGLSGTVGRHNILLGNRELVTSAPFTVTSAATIHLEIDGIYKGFFIVRQQWRAGLEDLLRKLSGMFSLHLLSGDNDSDKHIISSYFPCPEQIYFEQNPFQKLEYIKALQLQGENVLMIGDGLNDAGALKQSDIGIAVTENVNNFNPACDAILDGSSLCLLPNFISQAKDSVRIVKRSLIISASYNLIGIFFAVQGLLSPLTAAVLMPLSTITILLFTSNATRYYARKNHLRL